MAESLNGHSATPHSAGFADTSLFANSVNNSFVDGFWAVENDRFVIRLLLGLEISDSAKDNAGLGLQISPFWILRVSKRNPDSATTDATITAWVILVTG